MANLQGYTSAAVGKMIDHYERRAGDGVRRSNPNIDPSRTHLNYHLLIRRNPEAFVQSRITKADTKPTKATNVISDWVITLPKNDKLEGREREFFEAATDFLTAYVGEERVVTAVVHMDETSPHLHFCFVPLCEQTVMTNDKSQPLRWTARDEAKNPAHKAGEVKRDSKGTVRYKRVAATDEDGNPITKKTISQSKMFDRRTMQEFHPRLAKYMEERFGFDVGVTLSDEDEGDKILSRLEHGEYVAAKKTLAKTEKEVKRLTDKREEIREQTEAETERLEELRRTGNATAKRVEALEAVTAECRAADDAEISRRSAAFRRIAALCAGFIERLGGAVRKAADTAKQRLTLNVRNTAQAGETLRDRNAAAARRAAEARAMAAQSRQMQKVYQPQI